MTNQDPPSIEHPPGQRPGRSGTSAHGLAADGDSRTLGSCYQAIIGELANGKPTANLVALTSCNRGEGVSTIAVQLAIHAARQSLSVLLVDCNEDNPCLHKAFGLNSRNGFQDFLGNGDTLDSIQTTLVRNLSLMPYGRGRIAGQSGRRLEEGLNKVRAEFDLVVLDLPALNHSRHTIHWGRSLDNLYLVVGNRTTSLTALESRRRLEKSGGLLSGIIRNHQ